jgi:hypothetical protein
MVIGNGVQERESSILLLSLKTHLGDEAFLLVESGQGLRELVARHESGQYKDERCEAHL